MRTAIHFLGGGCFSGAVCQTGHVDSEMSFFGNLLLIAKRTYSVLLTNMFSCQRKRALRWRIFPLFSSLWDSKRIGFRCWFWIPSVKLVVEVGWWFTSGISRIKIRESESLFTRDFCWIVKHQRKPLIDHGLSDLDLIVSRKLLVFPNHNMGFYVLIDDYGALLSQP